MALTRKGSDRALTDLRSQFADSRHPESNLEWVKRAQSGYLCSGDHQYRFVFDHECVSYI